MQRHIEAVREALDILPYGVRLISVEHDPPQHRGAMPLPPGHARIRCRLTGWGSIFERLPLSLSADVDLNLPPEDGARRWMERASRTLRGQTDLCERASAAGVTHPIDLNSIFPTSHLMIDRAAADQVMHEHNDPACWIHQQIEFARAERLDDGAVRSEISIAGAMVVVPILFDPLRIGRGYGERSPLPLWVDDGLILGEPLPSTACSALIGRPVSAYISGTPVDRRIILTAETIGTAGVDMSTIMFEPDRVRLDDILPRRA